MTFIALLDRFPLLARAWGSVAPHTCFNFVNGLPCDRLPWTDRKTAIIVSFDCDTALDAQAFPKLIEMLHDSGVTAAFGVIAELLREQPQAYRDLQLAGHELFCHGARKHTAFVQGRYESCLFYNQLCWSEIEEEIVESRRALHEVLGISALGFRTPHFGTFQSFEQAGRMHELLRRHGFKYSSSTSAWVAKKNGYGFSNGFWEFPLCSRLGSPRSIIDSWSYLERDRKRGRVPRLYRFWTDAIAAALEAPKPVLVNVYFDPSHVVDYEPFSRMLADIDRLRQKGLVWSGTYRDAIEQGFANSAE